MHYSTRLTCIYTLLKLILVFLNTAVLGLHGLLTQEQSSYSDVDMIGKSLRGSGLRKAKPSK